MRREALARGAECDVDLDRPDGCTTASRLVKSSWERATADHRAALATLRTP
ncbi:hypothetical protein [Streptomyces litmocidini]|uniref:hypothetical protein n=1 Tax=Streptomyces litmocidini TaxID=67318 RepID=UPI0036F8C0D4